MVDAERAAFEAFATSKVRRDEGERFMARAQNGEYVSPAARAAWAAWQGRGLWEADQLQAEGERALWRTNGNPAPLLRAIQLDAAHGINCCAEICPSGKGHPVMGLAEIFSTIHRRVALAMQLKPAQPKEGGNV
jgi:hypothetical protein